MGSHCPFGAPCALQWLEPAFGVDLPLEAHPEPTPRRDCHRLTSMAGTCRQAPDAPPSCPITLPHRPQCPTRFGHWIGSSVSSVPPSPRTHGPSSEPTCVGHGRDTWSPIQCPVRRHAGGARWRSCRPTVRVLVFPKPGRPQLWASSLRFSKVARPMNMRRQVSTARLGPKVRWRHRRGATGQPIESGKGQHPRRRPRRAPTLSRQRSGGAVAPCPIGATDLVRGTPVRRDGDRAVDPRGQPPVPILDNDEPVVKATSVQHSVQHDLTIRTVRRPPREPGGQSCPPDRQPRVNHVVSRVLG